MLKNLQYKIKRLNAKTRIKRRLVLEKDALRTLNFEQKEIFDLVVGEARKHPEAIRYDRIDNETLIVLKDLILTIKSDSKDYMVYIDNHRGFHSQWFYQQAYVLINEIVDREAHRFRRKLKHETKMNIRAFLRGIAEDRHAIEAESK